MRIENPPRSLAAGRNGGGFSSIAEPEGLDFAESQQQIVYGQAAFAGQLDFDYLYPTVGTGDGQLIVRIAADRARTSCGRSRLEAGLENFGCGRLRALAV